MASKDRLSVIINSPDKVIWEGEVTAISSENSEGKFDVLPEHANFITLIQNKPIELYRPDSRTESFLFDQAVIYVHDNNISIYAGLEKAKDI